MTQNTELTLEELVEALNDDAKADEVMRIHNLDRNDLVRKAEQLSKKLSSKIAAVNMV